MGAAGNYGVQEQDPIGVNWADIGKGFSDMFANEAKSREAKKAAIDEDSRQFQNKLSTEPLGDNATASQLYLQTSSAVSDYSLQKLQELKSGKLALKDYLSQTQNLKDGVDNMISIKNSLQAEYTDKMERLNSLDPKTRASAAEMMIMANSEKYQNFNKSGTYVDPATGHLNVGIKQTKIVNGKEVTTIVPDPNNVMSINALKNIISQKINYFDAPTATANYVESLGDKTKIIQTLKSTLYRGGEEKTITDPTLGGNLGIDDAKADELYKRAVNDKTNPYRGSKEQWVAQNKNLNELQKSYETLETSSINSLLANDNNTLSALIDTKKLAPNQKPYGIAYTEADQLNNPEKILLKINANNVYVPDFSTPIGKKQYSDAVETLRGMIRLQIDHKESTEQLAANPDRRITPTPPHYKTEYEYDRQDKMKNSALLGQSIGGLKSSNPAIVDNSLRTIEEITGKKANIKGNKIVLVTPKVIDKSGIIIKPENTKEYDINEGRGNVDKSLVLGLGLDPTKYDNYTILNNIGSGGYNVNTEPAPAPSPAPLQTSTQSFVPTYKDKDKDKYNGVTPR